MNNRKQIDEFLLNLEAFIAKYHILAEDVYWVEQVFIPMFKSNKDNKTFVAPNKRWLEIPKLTALCNPYKVWYIRYRDRDKLEKQFKKNRTSIFVQSIAYKFKYKLVKDVSYEHILIKYLRSNSFLAKTMLTWTTYEWKLSEYNLKEFLIPEDWEISEDLFVY